MRRVLPQKKFVPWLEAFLPDLSPLTPVTSPDPSDPKFSHLDGLNLSRAWMLEAIARALPDEHPRRKEFLTLAAAHAEKGLAAVTGENYEGAHWLATFAVYFLSPASSLPASLRD